MPCHHLPMPNQISHTLFDTSYYLSCLSTPRNCGFNGAHLTPEELNIGVSLSLWRALQEERLDECRRLLQDKATIDHF